MTVSGPGSTIASILCMIPSPTVITEAARLGAGSVGRPRFWLAGRAGCLRDDVISASVCERLGAAMVVVHQFSDHLSRAGPPSDTPVESSPLAGLGLIGGEV